MSAENELTAKEFRRAVAEHGEEHYELTLVVSGASDSSVRAITNIREICDAHLKGRHRLSIVDLNQEPGAAGIQRVLATPTLIKGHPLPERVLVGDMSDHLRIMLALDVKPGGGEAAADPPEPETTR